ncbi:hypothetical protein GG804_16145 [Sphingomonas histidinilytica]|jgi:hypothetical protein|uniref:Uncharacterized protein n=2 Tax=Rhizorhabdus histidinilytica TaxID=439228 RepID=A0A1T5CFP8_9SPHN|nr:hypothetical protein [Rhizorhabdus histidinilytica]MBO9378301.1 hypothetical protein [Rhizorhabdus histidinilytica]QEH78874.1 hypothetical protein EIK56_12210 [Sphingomonas sp. C8-2]SKB58249.1 hypothetical protein SAMN06295920_10434 [Rhizorhabdus histidinilytica]
MSPLLLCMFAAMTGGITAGAVAVHGLRPNSYGPMEPPSLFAPAEAGEPSETDDTPDDLLSAARCDQCSERDLGYRWAVLAAVHEPGQCPNDSWAFRRGCLDYVGGI